MVSQYKINIIKNGTMESAFTKIDHFLISLFKQYDKDDLGTISLDDMMKALKSTNKIKLSLLELCLIRSFQDLDDDMKVQYKVAAR